MSQAVDIGALLATPPPAPGQVPDAVGDLAAIDFARLLPAGEGAAGLGLALAAKLVVPEELDLAPVAEDTAPEADPFAALFGLSLPLAASAQAQAGAPSETVPAQTQAGAPSETVPDLTLPATLPVAMTDPPADVAAIDEADAAQATALPTAAVQPRAAMRSGGEAGGMASGSSLPTLGRSDAAAAADTPSQPSAQAAVSQAMTVPESHEHSSHAPAVAAAASPPRFAALADVPATRAPRVDGDDFAENVGTRLSWMAEHRIGRAEIRVSPPELGAIDITLKLDGKQVRAEFASAHADVRAALEAGLPRLREMMAGQGLTLTHAQVGGQDAGAAGGQLAQRGDGQQTLSSGMAGDGSDAAEEAAETVAHATLRGDGLLDEYA